MARAHVLETAEQRSILPMPHLRIDTSDVLVHSNRVRRGLRKRVVLTWGPDSNDWHRYLFAHYEANRRGTFAVDLGDGEGEQTYRYVAPPSFSARGGALAGTYSVTIERD